MSNQTAGYEQEYQEMAKYQNQINQVEQNQVDTEIKQNEKVKGKADQQNQNQNLKKTEKSVKEIIQNYYQREDTASDENHSQEGDPKYLKKLQIQYKKILREQDLVKSKLRKIKDIRANEFKANMNLIQEINKLKSKIKEKEDYISNLTYEKEKMKQEINVNKKDWYDVLTEQKILKKLQQHSEELKQQIKKIKNIDNSTDREEHLISAYKAMIQRKAEGIKLTSGESREKYKLNSHNNETLQAQQLVKFNNLKQEIRIFQNLLQKQSNMHFKTAENLKKTVSHYLVTIKENEQKIKQIHKNAKSLSSSSKTLSTRLFKIQSTKNLHHNNINSKKNNNLYIGNKLLLDKSVHKEDNFQLSISGKRFLTEIVFFSRGDQANQIIFQCRYSENTFGMVHNSREYLDCSQNEIHINCEDLEEIKIYYSYKIQGMGMKMRKNQLFVLVGQMDENSQMQLINFTNKKLIGLGSYWYSNQLVGLNFRYISTSKSATKNRNNQQRLLVRQQYFN